MKAMIPLLSLILSMQNFKIVSVEKSSQEASGEMVWIPAGTFAMGTDTDKDALIDEGPAHQVKVDGFWIDSAPVTNRQFKKFVDATGYKKMLCSVCSMAPTASSSLTNS